MIGAAFLPAGAARVARSEPDPTTAFKIFGEELRECLNKLPSTTLFFFQRVLEITNERGPILITPEWPPKVLPALSVDAFGRAYFDVVETCRVLTHASDWSEK